MMIENTKKVSLHKIQDVIKEQRERFTKIRTEKGNLQTVVTKFQYLEKKERY